MTSTQRELGDRAPTLEQVARLTADAFGEIFSLTPVATTRAELDMLLGAQV